LFLLAAIIAADDKTKPEGTPAERLAAIQQEEKEAEAEFRKAVTALPDTPEGEKKSLELFEAYDKGQTARFAAAVALAKSDPKSDVGFAALEWVLTEPRSYHVPPGKSALELITEYYATSPRVGKIVAWVGYYPPQKGEEAHEAAIALIDAVAAKNPDPTARGQAYMAKAWEAKRKFAVAEHTKSADTDKLADEAEKAFETIVKDFADCPRLISENTLGEVSRRELFELRHLRIGKVAPEIEGEDLQGVKFKLGDYRGKVVVLDFWGDW
jgi:hypothetical protein